jgi:hypothetical protein
LCFDRALFCPFGIDGRLVAYESGYACQGHQAAETSRGGGLLFGALTFRFGQLWAISSLSFSPLRRRSSILLKSGERITIYFTT